MIMKLYGKYLNVKHNPIQGLVLYGLMQDMGKDMM